MIRTPPGWGADMLTRAYHSIVLSNTASDWQPAESQTPIVVRRIHIADLRWALARGVEDFGASRSDVLFLCVIYPLVGLLLARLAFGYQMLPLVFPLAAGFALIGPLAAVGLNDMSRRRERGLPAGFAAAFGVFRAPSILPIALLGGVLIGLFVAWLVMAQALYAVTLGPAPPVSLQGFAHDLLFTSAGRTMMVVGCAIGFGFAVVALAISVVSFPLLLDRPVSLETAVRTSVDVVRTNPLTMAAWGVIVAGGLVLGSVPLLLGLIVVMPVLGHATWHLYRRVIPR